MEDKGTMEQRFGKYTLDELKKACEICLDNSKKCSDGCPLVMDGPNGCREGMITSIVELINSYKTTLTLCEHWFKRADALSDKGTKYDSVRNELIRTQEVVKNLQDECRERADKIKTLREMIDAMDDDYNELSAKLDNAEMVQKSLKIDIKNITDQLDSKQQVINQLMKEKDETNAELLHYHVLLGSLKAIGKAIFNDQSGNHEKD